MMGQGPLGGQEWREERGIRGRGVGGVAGGRDGVRRQQRNDTKAAGSKRGEMLSPRWKELLENTSTHLKRPPHVSTHVRSHCATMMTSTRL